MAVIQRVRTAGRHCTILKRDIKDAFRIIPVATGDHWLLGFQWENSFYTETCLPFGLRTAPALFNLFAEALHWILQYSTDWKSVEHYLDDFMLVIPVPQATTTFLEAIRNQWIAITDFLGIPRNDSKDIEGRTVTILGYEVDTDKLEARIPNSKKERISQLCSELLTQSFVSLGDARRLAGLLNFCASVVQLGRVYLQSLWSFIAKFPYQAPKTMRRRLSAEVRNDIIWWSTLLPQFNGVSFIGARRHEIYVYTDACRKGLGGFFFSGYKGVWKSAAPHLSFDEMFAQDSGYIQSDVPFNINLFEVTAVLEAFKRWAYRWRHCRVIVVTDNITTQTGLTQETLRGEANIPLRQIMLCAAEFDVEIRSFWLAGVDNSLADALSRFDASSIANFRPQLSLDSISLLHPPTGSEPSGRTATR